MTMSDTELYKQPGDSSRYPDKPLEGFPEDLHTDMRNGEYTRVSIMRGFPEDLHTDMRNGEYTRVSIMRASWGISTQTCAKVSTHVLA